MPMSGEGKQARYRQLHKQKRLELEAEVARLQAMVAREKRAPRSSVTVPDTVVTGDREVVGRSSDR
jgi:hypothetical protein